MTMKNIIAKINIPALSFAIWKSVVSFEICQLISIACYCYASSFTQRPAGCDDEAEDDEKNKNKLKDFFTLDIPISTSIFLLFSFVHRTTMQWWNGERGRREKMEIIIDTQICISKSRATPYTSLYNSQLMHNTNKRRKEKKIKKRLE